MQERPRLRDDGGSGLGRSCGRAAVCFGDGRQCVHLSLESHIRCGSRRGLRCNGAMGGSRRPLRRRANGRSLPQGEAGIMQDRWRHRDSRRLGSHLGAVDSSGDQFGARRADRMLLGDFRAACRSHRMIERPMLASGRTAGWRMARTVKYAAKPWKTLLQATVFRYRCLCEYCESGCGDGGKSCREQRERR